MARVSVSGESAAKGSQWTQLCLGLGFTTLATLLLELSLTRLFSVVFYYDLAFLAISIALFGFAAGGIFSYVIANRPGNLSAELGRLTFINSVVVVLLLWFILTRHGDLTFAALAGVFVASAVPFFFAGTVVSLAMSEATGRMERAYFWDLMGAAAGCLLFVPFIDLFGAPNTVIASGVIYGVAASIWFNRAGQAQLRASAVVVSLLLMVLMIMNGTSHIFEVQWAKGERLPQERMSKWNALSRVSLTQAPQGSWDIRIDSGATTAIPNIDFSKPLAESDRSALLNRGPGLPYLLRPAAKTVILGAGGGYDLARALASGSKDVTGVEINPIIAKTIMRGTMRKESFGIYERPEVRIFVEDGRSFIRSSQEKYEVLQATLVDTGASTAAGGVVLAESHLYTVDAFEDYLAHLTDDGIIAFSRTAAGPPRESLRIVSLAIEALSRLGENEAASHVIVVHEPAANLDTVLVSRKPFSEADKEHAGHISADIGMEVLYIPGAGIQNPFAAMLETSNRAAFWRDYDFDVTPVDDDRPFFFYTVQPRDLWSDFKLTNKTNRALPLLIGLMGLCLFATLLILVLPRLVTPKQKGIPTFLIYFVCLGAGYMLVQMALVQQFIILLGQPTRALTVIIFAMLVASGAGSYYSRTFVAALDARLMIILAAVAALIALLSVTASPLVDMAATWPLAARLLLVIATVAPAAFFMGIPFPSGLTRLEERHAPALRWAWSLHAAASVVGSVASVVLAIYFGLRATVLIGCAMYLVALLTILITRRNPA
ncbi:MAG: hypothetical protein ABIR70_07875 [Bryobacteraceae bacterium]